MSSRTSARRSIVLAVLLPITLLLPACDDDDTDTIGPIGPVGPIEIDSEDDRIDGSGEIATESRAIADVDQLVMRGEGRVVVRQGAVEELSVTTDDDLLEYIETEVVGGTLEIRTRAGVDIEPSDSVAYYLVVGDLTTIELAGAGAIEIDEWATDTATARLPGAGEIRVGRLDATHLDVEFEGVGSIQIAGTVESQDVVATGVGEYLAADLASRNATVVAGGTASAAVWASEALDVDVSGAATVTYRGTPDVDLDTADLGVVMPSGASAAPPEQPSVEPVVEEVTFTSDAFELVSDLALPGGSGPHPAVIVVHGDGPQTRCSTPGYDVVRERFGDAGYAVFSWDKPGSGDSTGEFDGEFVLTERAGIVLDAVALLASDGRIDAGRIGLWGLSQAGWVMPLALDQTDDIAFMVSVSGGAEDGIEQTGFQLAENVRCDGGSPADADLVETYMPQYAKSPTYDGYVEAMQALATVPELRPYMATDVADEEDWQPWPPQIDAYFDPMSVISETTIPVLAVFGAEDRYVDPVQGAAAYEQALADAGNTRARVELLPGVGHIMETRRDACASTGGPTSERYLTLIDEWLVELDST